MEDFLNLHGISRSDIELKEKEKAQRRQRGNKRNSKFVRSDALSPNSVNKLIIETEMEKINRKCINKTGGDFRANLNGNNNESKMDLGKSVKNCFVRLNERNLIKFTRATQI